MARFAEGTTVSAEKSRGEIERILSRYGADAFGYETDGTVAIIKFRAHGRYVRFIVPLPPLSDFRLDGRGYLRKPPAQQAAHEQEVRRRWRALALAIKAKLEVVDSEIATFEQEFAIHTVLPDGSTVAERLMPVIEEAYESGEMPETLLELPAPPSRQIEAGSAA
jgi:hypothetical protein